MIAIKAAMVAGLKQQMEIIMAQIGSFTRGEDGVFAGTIKTLSLNVKARLLPADGSTNDKAPDLRVLVGNVEIGAAWRRAGVPIPAIPAVRKKAAAQIGRASCRERVYSSV